MQCKKCGEQLSEKSIFCQQCGAKVEQDKENKHVPWHQKIKWWGFLIISLIGWVIYSPDGGYLYYVLFLLGFIFALAFSIYIQPLLALVLIVGVVLYLVILVPMLPRIAKTSTSSINDIFGNTVNRCAKINRLAPANGLIIGEEFYNNAKIFDDYIFKKIDTKFISPESDYLVYHVSRKK